MGIEGKSRRDFILFNLGNNIQIKYMKTSLYVKEYSWFQIIPLRFRKRTKVLVAMLEENKIMSIMTYSKYIYVYLRNYSLKYLKTLYANRDHQIKRSWVKWSRERCDIQVWKFSAFDLHCHGDTLAVRGGDNVRRVVYMATGIHANKCMCFRWIGLLK